MKDVITKGNDIIAVVDFENATIDYKKEIFNGILKVNVKNMNFNDLLEIIDDSLSCIIEVERSKDVQE